MLRNINKDYSVDTFYYSLSILLERAAYYSLLTPLFMFITAEKPYMASVDAERILTLFMGSFLFSKIAGALLGDLLIGNRRSMFVGGFIQALGAFILFIPSVYGFYAGIFLIVLGNGLFKPNIIATYGKLYLSKQHLLDSGFTIWYLVINIGAALGAFLTGRLGESLGIEAWFIVSGSLMLLSLIPLLKTKEQVFTGSREILSRKGAIPLMLAFLFVGLSAVIFRLAEVQIGELQNTYLDAVTVVLPKSIWDLTRSYLYLLLSSVAVIVWTYRYRNQFFKLLLGFIAAAITFGLLINITAVPANYQLYYLMVSFLFLTISEVYIAPIIHSLLTRYIHPKYLAIAMSLAFLPTKLIVLGFGLFDDQFYDKPKMGLLFGVIVSVLVCLSLIGYMFMDKRNSSANE